MVDLPDMREFVNKRLSGPRVGGTLVLHRVVEASFAQIEQDSTVNVR